MSSRFPGGATTILLFAVLWTLGCGDHKLTSVTVTPATAVASSAGGEAQFTASGTYSDSSKPVPLQQQMIMWCVGLNSGTCFGNVISAANIDSTGLAKCVSPGTVAILAGTPGQQPATPDAGQQLQVFGAARLTCQ